MHDNLAKHTLGSKFVFVMARLDTLDFVAFHPGVILTNLIPAVILKEKHLTKWLHQPAKLMVFVLCCLAMMHRFKQ